jgi:hypothetical protein
MKLKNKSGITYIVAFFMLFQLFSSCEKDDICLEPTTPKLNIRFYDTNQTTDVKAVEHFSLTALPGQQIVIQDENTDSISIALNVNENSSKFIFINNNNTDTVVFQYEREFVFVSKSCGYKCIFKNLQANVITDPDNWIKNKEILNSEITVDTVAHVKIYH